MSNKQTFEKRIQQANNSIYFKFIGTEKNNNISYEKINTLINNCFNNSMPISDAKEKISWIRTILKDLEETYLEIEINLDKNYREKVIYINTIMTIYEKNIEDKIEINYNLNTKPNLSINITDLNLNSYHNYKVKEGIINSNIEHLYTLTKVTPIELTIDEKAICLFYKAFYNEYPNFNDSNINIRMQTMMSILTNFGICLEDNYSFMLNSKGFPVSISLSTTVKKLAPIGKIETIDNIVKLDELLEQDIKIIGETIKKYTSQTTDEIDSLKRISKIFYSGNNCIPTQTAIETISECCKIPIEEVESSLKLRKKIRQRLHY